MGWCWHETTLCMRRGKTPLSELSWCHGTLGGLRSRKKWKFELPQAGNELSSLQYQSKAWTRRSQMNFSDVTVWSFSFGVIANVNSDQREPLPRPRNARYSDRNLSNQRPDLKDWYCTWTHELHVKIFLYYGWSTVSCVLESTKRYLWRKKRNDKIQCIVGERVALIAFGDIIFGILVLSWTQHQLRNDAKISPHQFNSSSSLSSSHL